MGGEEKFGPNSEFQRASDEAFRLAVIEPMGLSPKQFTGTVIMFGIGPYFPERHLLFDGPNRKRGLDKLVCVDATDFIQKIRTNTDIALTSFETRIIPSESGNYYYSGEIGEYIYGLAEQGSEMVDTIAGLRLPAELDTFVGSYGFLPQLRKVLKPSGKFILTCPIGDNGDEYISKAYFASQGFERELFTILSNPSPAGMELKYPFKNGHIGIILKKVGK